MLFVYLGYNSTSIAPKISGGENLPLKHVSSEHTGIEGAFLFLQSRRKEVNLFNL